MVFLSGTTVLDVNGTTGSMRRLGALKQAPPAGDIVFSYAAPTGEALFVQGEKHDGEIDMLQRQLP